MSMPYTSYYDIAADLDADMTDILCDTSNITSSALGIRPDELPYLAKFFHGFCDAFALYLSQELGYAVIARFVMSSCGDPLLIHAACVAPDGYIDIRGFTPSIDNLFEEFEYDAEETIASLEEEFGEMSAWVEDIEYDAEGFCDYCMDRPGDFDDCRDELDAYGRLPFFDGFYIR